MAKKPPKPTDAELEILKVLWDRGPSTVREVHETLPHARPVGYTTILKLLQIMSEKGLVGRDERQRAHVYEPRLARDETQRAMVGDLLERVFDGSASKLLMQALSGRKATTDELAKIRALVDEAERGRR